MNCSTRRRRLEDASSRAPSRVRPPFPESLPATRGPQARCSSHLLAEDPEELGIACPRRSNFDPFVGSALGSLAWGWVSDQFGRRAAATGFVACAVLIPIYLFADVSITTLGAIGLVYGAALSCSAIWGPWMSELYPTHLRSTAASIFNWVRVISMMAPLAEVFGLAPVMCLASVSFLMAAVVWLSLPETVKRHTAP